jgi:hydrogenase maturation protein HypF
VVMTSGNRSDEPIAFDDARLAEQLGGIADFYLTHNRPIHLRCDDSVVRFVHGAELPIRRSRGYAPAPLALPEPCRRHVLAVGGQLKSVFALGRRQHAFLSHHIGDLDHYAAYHSFADGIEHFERLFAHRPELITHDLHPDYLSTRYAVERAEREGIARLAVQHHHAHLASCMAENGLSDPVIGVAFDGTGYGPDGAIWGGEFLVGDYRGYRRAGHFRYVPMPGGEQAIHEPWRMGLSYLLDAGVKFAPAQDWASNEERKAVEKMIAQHINAPLTSSVGRLFDGVAAIAGGRTHVSFEGQAAIELEWRALESDASGVYPFNILPAERERHDSTLQVDVRPLITAVAEERIAGASTAAIARRFHATLVEIIAQICSRIRERDKLNQVVLSGGVFMNGVLLEGALSRLSHLGFNVYRHRLVPPNDGGLALGQLAVAAAHDRHCA